MLINLGIEPSNVLNILPWNNGLVYVCVWENDWCTVNLLQFEETMLIHHEIVG
jgi:hypothetical protein